MTSLQQLLASVALVIFGVASTNPATTAAAAAAANSGSSSLSASATIKDKPPQLKTPYQSLFISSPGLTAKLVCPVYAVDEDLKPLVTWSKDGHLVHAGWDRYRMGRAGSTLLIDRAKEFDSGQYTCTAANGFGTVVVSLRLQVVLEGNQTAAGNWTSSGQILLAEHDEITLQQPILNADKSSKNQHETSSKNDEVLHRQQLDNDDGAIRYADAVMASMLCLGSAIAVTSLTALVAIAIRKRVLRRRRSHRIDASSAATNRLLFGKCDGVVTSSASAQYRETSGTNWTNQKHFYHPPGCSTIIGSLPITRPVFCRQSASCVDPYIGRIAMPTARVDGGRRTFVSTTSPEARFAAATTVLAWPQLHRYHRRYCEHCDCGERSFSSMCSSTESCMTV